MILKAELAAQKDGQSGDLSQLGRAAADFLLRHSDEIGEGFPGWGVPIAWDAYGDGTVNPAHTKYTISTAIVADTLLDWIEGGNGAPREKVISLLEGAFKPYADPANFSPSGLAPYSLSPADRKYDTFNPAGYMAGVMQRFSHFTADHDFSDRLRNAADKTVEAHLAHVRRTKSGSWYWNYSLSENVPNDLAHAGYIIHGLRLYAEHGGRHAEKLDLDAIEAHLADFVADDMAPGSSGLSAWPSFRSDTNTPARLYDVGMGLYLVCTRSPVELQNRYLAAVPRYRRSGGYTKYPADSGISDLRVTEYEAYLFLGLTSCLGRPQK